MRTRSSARGASRERESPGRAPPRAHVDLALWLVRRRSPSLADATARYLVFDARPSQAAYVMTDHLAHSDPLVERFGKSPLSYVQDLRVEIAVHRLRTTSDSIEEIAAAVGYGDGVTLRTLLRKKTGRGVRELRAR